MERILLKLYGSQTTRNRSVSNLMAFKDLSSIHHHLGLASLRSNARFQSKRNSIAASTVFKNILAAITTQTCGNLLKTRGLTIADYRAHPVISKSRFPHQPTPAPNLVQPKSPKRASAQCLSATTSGPPSKNSSPVAPKIRAVDPAKRPAPKIQKQPPESSDRQTIDRSVQKAAAKYNLPPELIRAVIRAESNFQVGAVSKAGAKGLMQLMPATARDLGVTRIFDIEQNIDGGSKYLRWMLDRFDGNVRKALAAYNAGPGTVIKYNGRVPFAETRQYVRRVLRFSGQLT